jgi:S1-C subfamily serine protease
MRRFSSWAIFISFCFVLLSCAQPTYNINEPTFPSSEVLQRSLRSTVIILNGDNINCSGVFVSNRLVLTAAHCLEITVPIQTNFGTIQIPTNENPIGEIHRVVPYTTYRRQQLDESFEFEVVAFERERDLALLRSLSGLASYNATVARISPANNLAYGLRLFTIGHPASIPWNITTGHITSTPEFNGRGGVFLSNAEVFNGNSGGPVFDMEGNLCGIASAIVARQPHLHRSIHRDSILVFLRRYIVAGRY